MLESSSRKYTYLLLNESTLLYHCGRSLCRLYIDCLSDLVTCWRWLQGLLLVEPGCEIWLLSAVIGLLCVCGYQRSRDDDYGWDAGADVRCIPWFWIKWTRGLIRTWLSSRHLNWILLFWAITCLIYDKTGVVLRSASRLLWQDIEIMQFCFNDEATQPRSSYNVRNPTENTPNHTLSSISQHLHIGIWKVQLEQLQVLLTYPLLQRRDQKTLSKRVTYLLLPKNEITYFQ